MAGLAEMTTNARRVLPYSRFSARDAFRFSNDKLMHAEKDRTPWRNLRACKTQFPSAQTSVFLSSLFFTGARTRGRNGRMTRKVAVFDVQERHVIVTVTQFSLLKKIYNRREIIGYLFQRLSRLAQT